jgi:hypothetical protein
MSLKKRIPPSDPLPAMEGVDPNSKDQNAVFDYVAEQQRIQDELNKAASSINHGVEDVKQEHPKDIVDSNEKIEINDENDYLKYEAENQKTIGHTSVDPDIYEGRGFDAAIQVKTAKSQVFEDTGKKQARPSTKVDLSNLDESMIMNMPEIKVSSYELIDILNPPFKDKSLRGRWANRLNHTAGNLNKYLSIGFSYACPDDIDQTKYKLDPSMVEGTHIQYYDIVLLKIPVLRLMQLYKHNIVASITKLGMASKDGVARANKQFQEDVSSDGNMSRGFNEFKAAHGKSPVEFYTPGAEESNVVNK